MFVVRFSQSRYTISTVFYLKNIQLKEIFIHLLSNCQSVAYFIEEVNPSVAKLPSNRNGSIAKLGLTF